MTITHTGPDVQKIDVQKIGGRIGAEITDVDLTGHDTPKAA